MKLLNGHLVIVHGQQPDGTVKHTIMISSADDPKREIMRVSMSSADLMLALASVAGQSCRIEMPPCGILETKTEIVPCNVKQATQGQLWPPVWNLDTFETNGWKAVREPFTFKNVADNGRGYRVVFNRRVHDHDEAPST